MALTGTYKDSLFTPMDTDQMQTVETPAAKVDQVQVLSAQASSSYELTMTGDKVQLRILDPVEFRKVRHLVIVTG
ncbi:MAG: hypothetical protein HYR74_10950, partial [Candidatus Eisenbacteria bacterium]|nr:hypothetical protein [Candidatus Eisenbacteria bacterium]